jgi:hypothetical protein
MTATPSTTPRSPSRSRSEIGDHRVKGRLIRFLGAALTTGAALVGLAATPASASTITWSQTPGNVTFSSPMARMGVYGPGQDSIQLDVNTVGASTAAGKQYAQVHLHVYYSCASTTGWCSQGSQNLYTGWFYTQWDLSGQVLSVPVPTGRYYTYVAETTWFNANNTIVGRETYYPTAGTLQSFQNGQWYYGNRDFACVYYAYQNHACSPYGLARAPFSPTGTLYVLKAG